MPYASLFNDSRPIFAVYRLCRRTRRVLATEGHGLTKADAFALSARLRAEHEADLDAILFETRTAPLSAQAALALPGYGEHGTPEHGAPERLAA